MNSFMKPAILFLILITLGALYRRYDDKLMREDNENNYDAIQKYLLNDLRLGDNKPILWIHVPYEYNSRKWLDFNSRSSYDLNQPYMYLTVKSIIQHCKDDFKIVIFDDHSFEKLIENWQIDMTRISNPILENIRTLGKMKLLYKYGGIMCPISFVCLNSLKPMYNNMCQQKKMLVCETVNRNITSSVYPFSPSIKFCGCEKNDLTMLDFINFIERTISNDYVSESIFLGSFDRWCKSKIEKNKMLLVDGCYIGTKTTQDKEVIVDTLLSSGFIDFGENMYGVYIPYDEILSRTNYSWFANLSEVEVLKSNTIIGNYILLSIAPNLKMDDIVPEREKKNWVGFWKTPLYNYVYGLKPNNLGNNLEKIT